MIRCVLGAGAKVPTKKTDEAAAYDICATENVNIPAHSSATVKTELQVEIPVGYCMRILPRSGLAFKHGIEAFPGLIDSDYRNQIFVLLRNFSDTAYKVSAGDSIAQARIERNENFQFEVVSEGTLRETKRGLGGLGSTGR